MSSLYASVRAPRNQIVDPWRPTTEEVLDYVINRRIRNNQNWIGAVCGETGSGKSYTALRIGEMVDPNFGADSVVFSVKEFIDTFESRPPGSLVVFDEGQEWSSRRSMSKKNVELTDIMAMLRFTRVNVLFTVPNIRMVDISLRRLMHGYLNVEPIDRAHAAPRLRDKSFARLYILHQQRRLGTEDDVRPLLPDVPITRGEETRKLRINSVLFGAPRAALLASYERRKHETFRARLRQARSALGGSSAPPVPPPPAASGASLEGLM
jgi:ABC-type dipeptide/oligopeptide/nickel transport system ATPase component